MKKIINVCADGNPLSASTWSKTPYNICMELEKRGVLGECIDTNNFESNIKVKLTKLFSYLYYNGSLEVSRGSFIRKKKNDYVCKSFSRDSKILHFSTLALPIISKENSAKHYVVVDSTWNLMSRYSSNKDKYKQKLKEHAENLEKQAFENAEHIFPISNYVKKDIIDHYKIDKNKITPIGTGRGIIQPFLGKKNYGNGKILFVAKGRFQDKGGELLIEAFKRAKKNNPKLELTIAGDENYKDLIGEIPQIKVFGFVTLEKLQSLFNEASLFVLPALYEPWGLVFLEALSCKIPIVGLNKNAFPEICRDGKYGFIIKEPSVEVVANTILDAFSSFERLETMGIEGQEYCLTNFSWEIATDKIINIILNN